MVQVIERQIVLAGAGKYMVTCICPRGPDGRVTRVERNCVWRLSEILYDGPANASKTFYDCYTIYRILTEFPDARVLGSTRDAEVHA